MKASRSRAVWDTREVDVWASLVGRDGQGSCEDGCCDGMDRVSEGCRVERGYLVKRRGRWIDDER